MIVTRRGVFYLAFLAALLAGPLQSLYSATLSIVSLFPSNGAVNVCEDAHLRMTFEKQLTLATSGNLQIHKASDDSVVWQVSLTTLPWPPSPWPASYQITVAGKTLNYYPVMASGNVVEIIPQSGILQYDTEYYVNVTAGFVTFGSDASPAITDTTTWRFRTRAAAPPADQDFIVAADGTGDYCTIQAAINATPNNSSSRTVIRVRNGIYRELINVISTKKKITLLGEDRDRTVVAAINCNNLNSTGSSYRCMMEVSADDFRMYNITFRNLTPQGGSQAETFKLNGVQRCVAANCEFYSFQDTLLISGSMYLADCYIEGDVDYIWGYGTTFFDRCHLRTVRSGGYNVQPRNDQSTYGYIFVDCTLTAPSGVTGAYLARDAGLKDGLPYFPYGQVVYIECRMGTHVPAIGWLITSSYDPAKLYFAEYHSMDLSGNLLNVSGRDAKSRQLSDTDGAFFRNPANVFGGWNPKALTDLPTRPWLLEPADGTTDVRDGVELSWTPGAEATSHMLYFGTTSPPQFLAELTVDSNSPPVEPNVTYYWRVDEKNANGTTAGIVRAFTTNRWFCSTGVSAGNCDFSDDCQVDFLDFALLASQWQMAEDPNNYIANGDFELPILPSGWTLIPGGAPVTLTRLYTEGNPDGAAKLSRPGRTVGYGDSRFYQIVPVTPGRRYELLGEWTGDLSGYADKPQWSGGATNMPRNAVEVFIAFVNSTAQPTTWGTSYYKKYYGFFFDGTMNIGDDGVWDWEPISSSSIGAPSDGYLATDNYMVVAISLSARAYGGSISVTLDNFRIREYQPTVHYDADGDLSVDLVDVAVIGSEWLDCDRLPTEECWR